MPSREALLRIIEIHSQVAQLGLDLAGVMSLSVHGTLELVDADGAAIELAEGEDLVYRAVAGAASHQLGVRVRRDGSLSGTCLRQGIPLICDDVDTDSRVDLQDCRRVGLRSMVVLPLSHQGTPVGVLKAFSSRVRNFGNREVEVLSLMSKVLGAAMYWATRYGRDDLFHRATHDDMTGLANRSLFMDRLRHATAEVERGDPPIAVVLLDMDGLKHINDTLGHAAGDAALIEFSRRLAGTTRESDTVARLGGDAGSDAATHPRGGRRSVHLPRPGAAAARQHGRVALPRGLARRDGADGMRRHADVRSQTYTARQGPQRSGAARSSLLTLFPCHRRC